MAPHPTSQTKTAVQRITVPIIMKHKMEQMATVPKQISHANAPLKPVQKQMTSAELIRYYTDRLSDCTEPARAMHHLYKIGDVIEPFEECGTEEAMFQFIYDPELQPLIQQLEKKFADLRKRAAMKAKEAEKKKMCLQVEPEEVLSKNVLQKADKASHATKTSFERELPSVRALESSSRSVPNAPVRKMASSVIEVSNQIHVKKNTFGPKLANSSGKPITSTSSTVTLGPNRADALRRITLINNMHKKVLPVEPRAKEVKPWGTPKRNVFRLPFYFKVRELFPAEKQN